eukprot:TRINITY_DN2423_c0_g1_i2.p1 TRINITY_DN2423_c0_g1~~TRINITY_DN2423_c0_g1_i2.p1  ORF type:complete len:132 (-),score=23.77 TRINITY_DN2423_c0_g1_i2:614-1009(-)
MGKEARIFTKDLTIELPDSDRYPNEHRTDIYIDFQNEAYGLKIRNKHKLELKVRGNCKHPNVEHWSKIQVGTVLWDPQDLDQTKLSVMDALRDHTDDLVNEMFQNLIAEHISFVVVEKGKYSPCCEYNRYF